MNTFTSPRALRTGLLMAAAVVSVFLLCVPALGSDPPPKPGRELENNLDERLAELDSRVEAIALLEGRMEGADGITREVLGRRLAKARVGFVENGLDFAEVVLKESEGSPQDFSAHRERAVAVLALHPELMAQAAKSIRARIQVPEPGLPAAEEAAAYSEIFAYINEIHHFYGLIIRSVDLAAAFGVEVKALRSQLRTSLSDQAETYSILLELATQDVRGLKAGSAVLPEDVELQAKLSVANSRVRSLAEALVTSATLMDELGMDTAIYSEQAIAATGQVSAEALDEGVLGRLLLGWGRKLTTFMIDEGPDYLLKALLFLVVIFLFWKLSKVTDKVLNATLERSAANLSQLLRRMVVSVTAKLVLILGVLIALSQIGISLGPLLAGLGVAGFVIGFALQDVLANFASGMMIVVYRPFDVGDLIETNGVFGTVKTMSLVNTTILTLDNQSIVIPNNKIWGDVIKNVTSQHIRRVDMVFGISYGDDIELAEKVLQDVVGANALVLDDPEPMVRVHELGDSSVNFVVRPWVKTEDYWETYWAVTRAVKLRFDEEGISIPFPQRDMHLDTSEPLNVRLEGAPQASTR